MVHRGQSTHFSELSYLYCHFKSTQFQNSCGPNPIFLPCTNPIFLPYSVIKLWIFGLSIFLCISLFFYPLILPVSQFHICKLWPPLTVAISCHIWFPQWLTKLYWKSTCMSLSIWYLLPIPCQIFPGIFQRQFIDDVHKARHRILGAKQLVLGNVSVVRPRQFRVHRARVHAYADDLTATSGQLQAQVLCCHVEGAFWHTIAVPTTQTWN